MAALLLGKAIRVSIFETITALSTTGFSTAGYTDWSIFVFLYLMLFGIGSAIIAAHGYTLQESLFEYASAMGTVGLSVGVTSADAAPTLLWSETVGMFLGRLEFFTVFVGVVRLLRDTRPILA